MQRRIVVASVWLTALAPVSLPRTAWAAPPTLPPVQSARSVPVQTAAEKPELETVSREDMKAIEAGVEILRTRAIKSYDNREYVDSAEQWELAYGLVGTAPELAAERQQLGFDLAHAQVHAHAHDHQAERLERARALLWSFVAYVARPGHTPSVAEREQVDRATELLEIIGHRSDADWRRAQPEDLPPPQPSTERATGPEPSLARARGLIGGGAAGLALGIILAGTGGGLLNSPGGSDRGAIAALSIGCILGSAGTVTMVSGIVDRRRVIRASPMMSRERAGVALSGRF